MAKGKKTNYDDVWSDPEFGLDGNDLNFDDIGDIGFGGKPDARHPILRGASNVGKGFKDETLKVSTATNIIKKVFPKGAGNVVDTGESVHRAISDSYRDAERRIGPALKQTKGIIARLAPKESRFLPKALLSRISSWEESSSSDTQYNRQSQEIEDKLKEVFAEQNAQQAEVDAEYRKQDEARQDLQEAVNQKRHIDNIGILSNIHKSVTQTAQYTTTINARYQRAHLELMYRLVHFNENDQRIRIEENKRRDEFLAAISKNTSLPDYVKLKKSEAVVQSIRNKAFDHISGRLFGGASGVLSNTIKGVGKNIGYKVQDSVEALLTGLSGMEMMSGMAEGMGDKNAMYAQAAGSAGSVYGANKLGKWLGAKLPNSEFAKKHDIAGKNDALYRFFGSFENRIMDFKNNKDLTDDPDSIKSKLYEILQDLIPNNTAGGMVSTMNMDDLEKPVQATNRVNIAQHTVIPGYLARILREIQVWRTGQDVDLIAFDYTSARFMDSKALKAKVIESVIRTSDIEGSKRDLNNFIDDKLKGKDLSEESRKALTHALMTNSMRGVSLNKKNIDEVLSRMDLSEEAKSELDKLMSSYTSNRTANEEVEHTKTYNRFSSNIRDIRRPMQQYSDIGFRDDFEKLGLIDQYGYLDKDRLARIFTGQETLGELTENSPLPTIDSFDKSGTKSNNSRSLLDLVITAGKQKTQRQRRHVKRLALKGKRAFNDRYGEDVAKARAELKKETDELAKIAGEIKESVSTKIDPENHLGMRKENAATGTLSYGQKAYNYTNSLVSKFTHRIDKNNRLGIMPNSEFVGPVKPNLSNHALTKLMTHAASTAIEAAKDSRTGIKPRARRGARTAKRFIDKNVAIANAVAEAAASGEPITSALIKEIVKEQEALFKADNGLDQKLMSSNLPPLTFTDSGNSSASYKGPNSKSIPAKLPSLKSKKLKPNTLNIPKSKSALAALEYINYISNKKYNGLDTTRPSGILAPLDFTGNIGQKLPQAGFDAITASEIPSLPNLDYPIPTKSSAQLTLEPIQKQKYKRSARRLETAARYINKSDGKREDSVTSDIFNVKDLNTPWVRFADITARRLYNVTRKKIVKTIHDLNGRIIDKDGNQIITEADAPNMIVSTGNKVEPLIKVSSKVKQAYRVFLNRKKEVVTTLTGKKVDVIKDVKDTLAKMSNSAIAAAKAVNDDGIHSVYDARSPNTPLITVTDIAQGRLINVNTNTVITKVSDITGDVINTQGETVLKAQDIPHLITFDSDKKKMTKLIEIAKATSIVAKPMSAFAANNFSVSGFKDNVKAKAISVVKNAWKNADNDPVDIYVNGEMTPRVTAVKMQKGAYIVVETGEIVKKPEDLVGTIADTTDGNKIVLSKEEIPNIAILDKKTGKFSVLGIVKKILKAAFNWQFKIAPKLSLKLFKIQYAIGKFLFKHTVGRVFKGVTKKIGNIFGTGERSADSAFDVYVMNQPSVPALIGKYMEQGYYINEDGSPVLKVNQIKGAVRLTTDMRIVLTKEEFDQGLFDVKGRKINLAKGSIKGALLKGYLKGSLAASKMIVKGQMKMIGAAAGAINIFKKPNRDDPESEKNKVRKLLSFDMLKRALKSRVSGIAVKSNLTVTETAGIKTVGVLEDVKKSIDRLNDTVSEKEEGGSGGIKGWLENKALDKIGGKAGKVLGKLGGVGRFASGILGLGGEAAASAAAATGASTAVAGGAAAIGAEAAVAGGAATVAGAGVTGTLGAMATGALSFLASPVVLGALAIGGTAYLGYKLYKAIDKGHLDPVEILRMVQYGFKPDDTKHIKRMIDLESYLMDFIKDNGSMPSIDQNKIKTADIMGAAGISASNDAAKNAFFEWYQYRFKPVYLTHLCAAKQTFSKADLNLVHGCKPDMVKVYLRVARFSDGPYTVKSNPYLDENFELTTGEDVAKQIKVVEASIDENDKDGRTSSGKITDKKDNTIPSSAPKKIITSESLLDEKSNESALPNGSAKITGNYAAINSTEINGLDAIRFKAYGLKELELDKVRSLKEVEKYVLPTVSVKDGIANWDGDVFEVLSDNAGFFGIGSLDSPSALNWVKWFRNRFLPIYLKYLSGVYSSINKLDLNAAASIKPDAMSDIAKQLIGTNGIWESSESPWDDYDLNSDYRTCDAHLNYLDGLIKKKKLSESINASDKDGKPTSAEKSQGFFGKLFGNIFGNDDKSSPSANVSASSGASASGSQGSASSGPSSSGAIGGPPSSSSASSSSGGASPNTPGITFDTGSASTAADPSAKVPDVTGTGVKAVGPAVLGAAKLVGVNPVNAMSTVAMESGFDPNAKAKTSSAAGLYQFINSTWSSMINKYGSRFGVSPGTNQFDPKASSLMGALFIKDNESALKGVVPNPGPTDIYLAHFLGPGGAKKFLAQYKANPNEPAANIFSKEAAANKSIFFDKSGRALSYAEIYNMFSKRIIDKSKATGFELKATITPPGSSAASSTDKDAKTPALAGDGSKDSKSTSSATTTATPSDTSSSASTATPATSQANTGASKTTSSTPAGSTAPSAPASTTSSSTSPQPAAPASITKAPSLTPSITAAPTSPPPTKPIDVSQKELAGGNVNMSPFITQQPQPGLSLSKTEGLLSELLETQKSTRDLFIKFIDMYSKNNLPGNKQNNANAPSTQVAEAASSTTPPATQTKSERPDPVNYTPPPAKVSVKHRRYMSS